MSTTTICDSNSECASRSFAISVEKPVQYLSARNAWTSRGGGGGGRKDPSPVPVTAQFQCTRAPGRSASHWLGGSSSAAAAAAAAEFPLTHCTGTRRVVVLCIRIIRICTYINIWVRLRESLCTRRGRLLSSSPSFFSYIFVRRPDTYTTTVSATVRVCPCARVHNISCSPSVCGYTETCPYNVRRGECVYILYYIIL